MRASFSINKKYNVVVLRNSQLENDQVLEREFRYFTYYAGRVVEQRSLLNFSDISVCDYLAHCGSALLVGKNIEDVLEIVKREYKRASRLEKAQNLKIYGRR